MVSRKIATLVAGALLLASTAGAAQAAPSALSLAGAFQSSAEESSGGWSSSAATIAIVFGLAAFAAAVAFTDNDNDEPDSP